MIKLNYCKKVSRKYFCVANGLAFLTVIAMCSCEDNISNDITGNIENIEESVSYESDEYGITRKESFADIEARADAAINRYRKNRKAAYNTSDHPVWVGVLVSKGTCPNPTMEIVYHMDCEDNKDNDSRHGTRYEDENCYKSAGITWDSRRNTKWRVCVVDARKYKFGRMKYAYAIIDLSIEKFWNGAYEVFVHSDDEDRNNNDNYKENTYLGFAANNNYPYYPIQDGSFSNGTGWTNLWFYYFPADPTSKMKLPNLGFEYDVFSNFSCCDNSKQNLFHVDTEDTNPNNYIKIYKNANDNGSQKNGIFIDATYKIMANLNHHMVFAIQSSSVYRER